MGKKRIHPGPDLTGLQYEALCRHAVSRIYGIAIDQIFSGHVSGPSQRRQELRHQVDLYWETSDGVCSYRVFANAKWRTRRVQLGELMEVIGVWRDIGSHKAMIITNSGFDVGVMKQARAKGIALLIVRPVVDLGGLGTTKIEAVVKEVEGIASGREEAVFSVEVVHKGLGDWARGRGGEGENGRQGDKEIGRQGDAGAARAEEQGNRGAVEGNGVEGGIWLIGGGDRGGKVEGVEDRAMGMGQIRNKMM